MVYFEQVGDAIDQEFFYVSPNTGAILLRKSLDNTNINQFTFTVNAYDNRPVGVRKSAVSSVTIDIKRDQGPPQFVQTPYRTSVAINQRVNTQVYQVRAVDNDIIDAIRYRLDGFVPGTNYFGLNTSTGAIFLRSSLADTNINTFETFTVSNSYLCLL